MLKGKKGMTLIELMAASSIMLIVIVPICLMLNVWYKNYDIQNDTWLAQREARKIMDGIIEDLRKNENGKIAVGGNNTILHIEDSDGNDVVVYMYSDTDKKVLKNGIAFFDDDQVQVTGFNALEEPDANYDNKLINITLKVKAVHSEEISLQNNYRCMMDNSATATTTP